jgi:tetratricopeptide (TPR) repeat protein
MYQSSAWIFYRFTFVIMFLFSIGCTKVGWLSPERDLICEKEADDAIRSGDYQKGIRLHLALLNKEPNNALVSYHLGYAYGMAGDHVKEVQYYKKAIDLGHNWDAELYFNLGMAYGELNSIQNAITAFKRVLEINPDHEESRKLLNELKNK